MSINILELKRVVACIFKAKSTRTLFVNDLVYALSFDSGWFSPKEASHIVNIALDKGLIQIEANCAHIQFDYHSQFAPIGYKPSCTSLSQPLDAKILEIICEYGHTEQEVMSLARKRQMQLGGLIELEVALVLVARDLGIDVSGLAQDTYDSLLSQICNT